MIFVGFVEGYEVWCCLLRWCGRTRLSLIFVYVMDGYGGDVAGWEDVAGREDSL